MAEIGKYKKLYGTKMKLSSADQRRREKQNCEEVKIIDTKQIWKVVNEKVLAYMVF